MKKRILRIIIFVLITGALFYFNGFIVRIDIIMPLIFLFFGIEPVITTTSSFALFFIPFMFLNLYTLYPASGGSVTFHAISFSQSCWTLQLSALKAVLFKEKTTFSVTPKQKQQGNYLKLVYPHLFYIFLALTGTAVAITRYGLTPSVLTNVSWCVFNIILFLPFIRAAYKWSTIYQKFLTLFSSKTVMIETEK